MIRAVPLTAVALLAGCASPVVTRIDTAAPAPLPAQASFTLVEGPGDLAPVHRQANALVSGALSQRGWSAAETGDYLLLVSLSDRPATAELKAGDDAGRAASVIAPAHDRKAEKGCARRDYRLGVRLTHRVTGEDAYAGSGAEFHCKAALDESLPHLVTAALTGLDGLPGPRRAERKGVR
ncbi:MAG: hypothetical protein MEP44_08610 [Blastomonas sp.]|nr:hypothetical protein [Blastomonas sp.]